MKKSYLKLLTEGWVNKGALLSGVASLGLGIYFAASGGDALSIGIPIGFGVAILGVMLFMTWKKQKNPGM